MAQSICTVLLGLLFACLLVDAFYLPGLAPTNFCRKEIQDGFGDEGKKKCKVSLAVASQLRPL